MFVFFIALVMLLYVPVASVAFYLLPVQWALGVLGWTTGYFLAAALAIHLYWRSRKRRVFQELTRDLPPTIERL